MLTVASPAFIARCGPVDEWPQARLSGFRVLSSSRGVARVLDLADRTEREVLDIGTTGQVDDGEYAVGRLVPIAEPPGLMMESRLLPVPELVARQVARVRETAVLADQPGLQLWDWEWGSPCSDVPELAWRMLQLPEDADLDSPEFLALHRRVNAGRTVRTQDAVELLRSLLPHWAQLPAYVRSDVGALLAAALLTPGVARAAEVLSGPGWEGRWRELAEDIADPGRALCRALATSRRRDSA